MVIDDQDQIQARIKWMWSLGDFAELAALLQPAADALVAACDIAPGMFVLDVGAGTGNFALAAAERGARVTASDLTPRMVEMGRERSDASALAVDWMVANAEDLPFETDASTSSHPCSGRCSPTRSAQPPNCSYGEPRGGSGSLRC